MKMPHPMILDDLCRTYRQTHTREDLLSWWVHASRNFDLLPEYMDGNEPPEVTAARALWIHANLESDPQSRMEYSMGMWTLVSPYTKRRAQTLAKHCGQLI